AAQVAASLVNIPGLSMGVEALCKLIVLCEEVSANQNMTRYLCDQCHKLLLAVKEYQPQPPNTLQDTFHDITRCIKCVKAQVEERAKFSWVHTLVHLNQIQEDIKASHAEITESFVRFQLASSTDMSQWQTEFAVAAQSDHEDVITYLSEIRD
ncbi:hypothetical protein L218DRAFT_827141, partial [Marasmius fiardii PR-910]